MSYGTGQVQVASTVNMLHAIQLPVLARQHPGPNAWPTQHETNLAVHVYCQPHVSVKEVPNTNPEVQRHSLVPQLRCAPLLLTETCTFPQPS